MSRPQNNCRTLLRPQNQPNRAQKDKNAPKIQPNYNFTIQGIIENESCSTTWVHHKTVFEPIVEPKNSPLGPKKVNNNQKIKSKSNFRMEGSKENKSYCTI